MGCPVVGSTLPYTGNLEPSKVAKGCSAKFTASENNNCPPWDTYSGISVPFSTSVSVGIVWVPVVQKPPIFYSEYICPIKLKPNLL